VTVSVTPLWYKRLSQDQKEAAVKPLHILTLDDDKSIIEMLVEYFALCRHWVACPTEDPEQALEIVQRYSFDAVTTDIYHPGISGLEFAEIVRRLDGPPVIIASGYYYPELRKTPLPSVSVPARANPSTSTTWPKSSNSWQRGFIISGWGGAKNDNREKGCPHEWETMRQRA
jgi:CheY-like chemotaxis protein